MRHRIAAVALLLAVFAFLAPAGTSDAQTSGRFGIVPARPYVGAARTATTFKPARKRRANLIYHGGRILPNSTTYAIFWDPFGTGFPVGYVSAIETYFADIAADSGNNANVYSVAKEYFDTNPNGTIKDHVNYDVTDGGAMVDVDPLPGGTHCKSLHWKHCVKDSEIHIEIAGLFPSPGANDVYFMFLPPGVDTCAGRLGCMSDGAFCAYHSYFDTFSHRYIYANEPFANVNVAGGTCRTGEEPVGSQADATINTVSHEHNESDTDPTFEGWYARSGAENADKCAYRFGAALGTTGGGDRYNQVINGHYYYLQREWSNHIRGCKQRAGS